MDDCAHPRVNAALVLLVAGIVLDLRGRPTWRYQGERRRFTFGCDVRRARQGVEEVYDASAELFHFCKRVHLASGVERREHVADAEVDVVRDEAPCRRA